MTNIKDVMLMSTGDNVTFKAVLSSKELSPKNGGGNFLNLSFTDCTGKLSTPEFTDVDNRDARLIIGAPYLVNGTVNVWNGNIQLKNTSYRELKADEYSREDFISKYDIPIELIARFKTIVYNLQDPYKTIVEHAVGLDGIHTDRWETFLACPSAEKRHGNRIGGLFLHTFGVLCNLSQVVRVYEDIDVYGDVYNLFNMDRLQTKAIIHDLMKCNEYEYDTFIRRIPNVVGHIYDGIGYIEAINNECENILNRDELENLKTSILSHHGQYGPVEPKTLEDKLVHLSDMIDSRIVGELEKLI